MKVILARLSAPVRVSLAALILLTAVSFLFPLAPHGYQLAAFLLLFMWPAITWLACVDGPWLDRLVIAAALPPLVNALLALLTYYASGPMLSTVQLLLHTAVALLPLAKRSCIAWPSVRVINWRDRTVQTLAAIFILALALRLTNLPYSEFQGDEGVIMTRAAAMITGDDAEIFLHQKGPVEILIPLTMWVLGGQINEFWARLPFAWGSLLVVLALFVLARRWFGAPTALLAALFFALNGFGVAFGRIVQYQSFVMLWGTLAVLGAARYAAAGKRHDLVGTAVFLAGGLLAHYDAILVTPAVGWLLFNRVWQERRVAWRAWLLAGGTGALILALFYVPFVRNPNFARTGQYLVQGRLGASDETGLLSWSGAQVWQMITFYNSLYYVVGLALLAFVGLLALIKRGRARRGGVIAMAAVLLFFTPLAFYLFIVADPRTHVYTFFPGWTLLAAVGAWTLGQRWVTGRGRLAGWGVFALWVGVTAVYPWLLFVDYTPERQRTWAENRPRFYPTTWDDPPLYGIFGFPHQAGWRLAAELVTELPYASNEEQEVTAWYMAQAARTHCPDLATFVYAARVQDVVLYDPDLLATLAEQARVTVAGQPGLVIYGRSPTDAVPLRDAAGRALWRAPADVAPPTFGGHYPVQVTLGNEQVRLLGYDLDTADAVPGGRVVVTLYWQALAPFDQNYQVFTHLYDGELRAQHDGAPDCAIMPTTRWEPGRIIRDPHVISLPPDMPQGAVPLLVGMYNLLTYERLSRADTGADAIHITNVTVR